MAIDPDATGTGLPHAGHPEHARSANRRSLTIALALVSVYIVAEVIGGLVANSLALIADAGHMVTDAAAIGLALFAIWVAGREPSIRRTFGFQRAEVLTALLNAMVLWVIAAAIFFEASQRFSDPPDVKGVVTLSVGTGGLLVNAGAAWVLRRGASESLNVEGAFLHVLADLVGSIGVIVSGALVIAFGWHVADPIFGVLIGVLILFSSSRLLWKVVHVLMEGTPVRLDLESLCKRLEQVQGVTGVHDIHAWSVTTGYEVLSAHVTADMDKVKDPSHLLKDLREITASEFGINHTTIQLEDSDAACEESHHIAHS